MLHAFQALLAAPALAFVLATSLAPQDSAPLDFDRVAALAAPAKGDLLYREIDWLPTVLDGIVAAQDADKPIVLWLYFGGPLGDC